MEKVGVGRKDGSDGSDAVDGSVREDDSDAGDEKRPPIDMPSASKEGDSAERRRHLLLGFAFLYTTLFSGALFGWGPMQLLLEENGSFSSKCSDEEQAAGEICPSQSASLVKLHFIALLSQVCSPILGELLDRYGPAFISYLMAVSAWVGLGLLIVAAQTNVDEILFAAFIGIALSTWMGGLLTVQTAMVFQGRTRSRIIFVINSLFDAGSVTYLGLWGLAQAYDWSLTGVTSLYFGMSIVCFGSVAYFWTVVEPEVEETIALDDSMHRTSPVARLDSESGRKDVSEAQRQPSRGLHSSDSIPGEQKSSLAPNTNNLHADPAPKDTQVPSEATEYVLVADRSPVQQLISGPFLMAVTFTTIMMSANQWTLTTSRDFLAYLGDDEVDNKYLTIFTLLGPASLLAIPCTDAITSKYGFHGGLQGINVLALGYTLVRLLSDDLNVQILGFILFSFFRSFLFGVTFSILPVLLSADVVGKATGLLYALAGVTAYINVPLSKFALEQQNGDFFIPNLMYAILIAPCVVAAWWLGKAIEKEDIIRRTLQKDFEY